MTTPTLSRDPKTLLAEAAAGNRVALARLLTMVERGGTEAEAVAALAYRSAHSYTVGLTGPPGAGKSTLTDRLITTARRGWPEVGERPAEPLEQVAVLAIDPSSPFTGGAILGDRIRMQDHATDPTVFMGRNAMLLRNTTIVNFFDCCAISLPLPREGGLPVGLMLIARNGHDRRLLRIAAAVERLLAS